jgi:hypothetical protein
MRVEKRIMDIQKSKKKIASLPRDICDVQVVILKNING